jgi:hypothetical protein
MRDPVTTTVSGPVCCASAGESAVVKIAVIAAPRKSEERRLVVLVKGNPHFAVFGDGGPATGLSRAFGCFSAPARCRRLNSELFYSHQKMQFCKDLAIALWRECFTK